MWLSFLDSIFRKRLDMQTCSLHGKCRAAAESLIRERFVTCRILSPRTWGIYKRHLAAVCFARHSARAQARPLFRKSIKLLSSRSLALPQYSNTYSGHSDVLLPLDGFYPPSTFYIHIQGAGLRRSFDRRPPTAPSFPSSAGTILTTNLATPTVTSLRFLGRLINPTRILGLR
jgi:hypothetical protein